MKPPISHKQIRITVLPLTVTHGIIKCIYIYSLSYSYRSFVIPCYNCYPLVMSTLLFEMALEIVDFHSYVSLPKGSWAITA